MDLQFVPGTVHLVDIVGNLNVKKESGNIILQPQPSGDINDPLRWSNARKHFQFSIVWFWSFILAVAINFIGPIFGIWIKELGVTGSQLNIATAIGFLFLAVGVTLNQPTALKLGKRPVYLYATLLGVLALAVGSQATSIVKFYVFKVFIGFAASPVDSLVELSATDMYFQHERSTKFALLILALYLGSYLGPVAAGYVVDTLAWNWAFYIVLIIIAALFFILFFFLEETTFARDFDDRSFENNIIHQIKSKTSGVDPYENSNDEKYNGIIETQEINDSDTIGKTKSYAQKLKLFDLKQCDKRSWFTIFIRPFFLLGFPATIFGGAVYGAQMMWLSLMAVTQSEIYGSPPYNFSPGSVGLTNLGACVGCIVGMAYGGYFVDWLTIKLSERNDGIYEPEFRLYAMIVPTFINAAGILAYGLGSYDGAHWAISVVIGQGFIGFSSASTAAICLTYAVDSYHNVSSEIIVCILVIRNLIGCGFTFAVAPWLQRDGLKTMTWLLFMISVVINGSFIFLIVWGKTLRRKTANFYEKISDPMFGEYFK